MSDEKQANEMANCPYCGKLIGNNMNDCPHCGGSFIPKSVSTKGGTKEKTAMKYWYVAYMVLAKTDHTTNITYGNTPASYNLSYLPIKRVREAIEKCNPNSQVIILNFQEIPKESFDELTQG